MMEIAILSPSKKESTILLPDLAVTKLTEKLTRIIQNVDGLPLLNDDVFIHYIKELLDSSNKKHLDVLKKITKNIANYSSSHLWFLLVEILINGLYYCHSNHIVKSSINGVIRHMTDKDIELVSTLIHEKLDTSVNDEMFGNEMNGVELVAALLQSEFGCKAILSCEDFVIDFFSSLLAQLSNDVQLPKPTTETVKLHSNIHSLTRTLLSVFKLINVDEIPSKIQKISCSIITVLNLKELPLEVQGNCSKILIVLTKCQKNGMQCLIKKIMMEKDHSSGLLTPLEDTVSIRINLSIALLSSLGDQELLENQHPYGTLLGGVILSIILTSCDALNETGLALLTIRLVEQWQRKCYQCFTSLLLAANQSFVIEWRASSDRLLEIILNGLENQIDVVRHTAKEAFFFNLKIHLLLRHDVERIVQTTLAMPTFKKSKYIALVCLAKTELVSVLLRPEYNVIGELLDVAKYVDLVSQAKEVFNLLMLKNIEQSDEWIRCCLHPLLTTINHSNGQSFESSLVDLLKLHPEIMRHVETWCQVDCSSRLSVYITALLASRKLGLFPTNIGAVKECLWDDVVKTDLMEQALQHEDGKLRLNALGVIIEGPKSTQLYSHLEIAWVRQFITCNMNNSNAAFRQQLCSYLKKFLFKIRNGGIPLIGRNDEIVANYRNFVSWFIEKCLLDLGPGSSFPRRFLSLQFLNLMQDFVGLECNPNGLNVGPCLGLAAVSSLVDCFFDSYDVNKELALHLLQSPPLLTIVSQDPKGAELLIIYWETSLILCQSLRSADASAAGFLFLWLIRLSIPKLNEQEQSVERKAWSLVSSNNFDVITRLMRMLKSQLDAAQENLCLLAVNAPMYGLLSSIRLLLNDQQSRADEMKTGEWRTVVSSVVSLCFEASAIASPVVTCDSPEGFIPESPSVDLNAQALLVSAWHTVKEVALLFGQLSSWALGSDYHVLDNKIIVEIGQHLKHLLLQTKHRGAFEQVYCGFSQFCYALWRSPIRDLNKLPALWLLEIVRDLKVNESTVKFCATRRSAGLPFVFQAVLSPEVEMGHGELFNKCIESLLNICADGRKECRIHALNILRNLYRESRLNQVIGPYVYRGLMLSIAGFEALDWAERNSSTLLFSALMTRIFGVPRSKNDIQKKNSLTGRVFFQQFPMLYPFLLERLTLSVADINNKGIHLHPALFPILVLLGRLHPAACELSDSAFKLEAFVPLVRLCGSSPVLKTRQLAAQALTPLLTPASYARMMSELLNSIPISTSRNQLHGTLLQIHCFVKDVPKCSETRNMVFGMLKHKIPQLIFLLRNSCFLIRYEYAEILLLLYSAELYPSAKENVSRMCMDEIRDQNLMLHGEPFYPLACQKLAALAMALCNGSETSNVIELLNHPLEEVRLEVMRLLDQMDSTTEWALLRPMLETIVTDENASAECRTKALKLFSHFDATVEKLKWLLGLYKEVSEDSIRCSALAAAGQTIHSVNLDNHHLLVEWSLYLLEAMQSAVQFRKVVIESIATFPVMFQMDDVSKVTRDCGPLLANLWMCLLYCLIDDEDSIRTAASVLIGNVCGGCFKRVQPVVALEKGLEFFVSRVGTCYPMEVISMLSRLVLDENEQLEVEESLSFEKSDCDRFREPLAHSLLFCQFIELCAKQQKISLLDSNVLAEYLEVRWQMFGNCDFSPIDSLSSDRRFASTYFIGLMKFYKLTNSLFSVHEKIRALHLHIRKLLKQVKSHWLAYLIQHFSLISPVSM